MSDDREKNLWPWIVALLIGLPVLYVASFGPACRLLLEDVIPVSQFTMVYRPCVHFVLHGPQAVRGPLWWWAEQCGGENVLLELVIIGEDCGQVLIFPGDFSKPSMR